MGCSLLRKQRGRWGRMALTFSPTVQCFAYADAVRRCAPGLVFQVATARNALDQRLRGTAGGQFVVLLAELDQLCVRLPGLQDGQNAAASMIQLAATVRQIIIVFGLTIAQPQSVSSYPTARMVFGLMRCVCPQARHFTA